MIEHVRTHPLTQMIEMYCNGYDKLRDEWLDLPPIAFHRRHGLVVQVPVGWDVLSSVKYVVNNMEDTKIIIIFGSSESYRDIYDTLGDRVSYFSWHEIFTGIHTSSMDIRYLTRSKQLLSEAGMTFFLNPPAIPEVMDQVCGQTLNCLVVLSEGGL